MKERLSIKVDILGKTFPLKVTAEEEENVRKAADLINKKVTSYIEQYSIKDKQVALSMCALEMASDLVSHDSRNLVDADSLNRQVSDIEELLREI